MAVQKKKNTNIKSLFRSNKFKSVKNNLFFLMNFQKSKLFIKSINKKNKILFF
jgi:hypothetical protein